MSTYSGYGSVCPAVPAEKGQEKGRWPPALQQQVASSCHHSTRRLKKGATFILCAAVVVATTAVSFHVASKTSSSSSWFRSRSTLNAQSPQGSPPALMTGDVSNPGRMQNGASSTTQLQQQRTSVLEFTVTNFYHERDGKPGALIPWLSGVKLAEPYRDTTLEVTEPRDGHTYKWEVRNIDNQAEVLATATGVKVQMIFEKLDLNMVVLVEVHNESGRCSRELTDTVMVKYVRREIRTLTDDEREELLDAMATLWNVKVMGGNGQEVYGENYQDIWAINRLHFKGGGSSTCDHFHEGLGFLTSHSLLTNTFEYSLQLVNPKLTVPYWDFTIEKSTFGGNTPSKIENQRYSPLLLPEWFGSADPDDGIVKDGRWAFTEIPRVALNDPSGIEGDVYSKLRSPWNVNDRPYLSRGMGEMCGVRVEEHYPWPSCDDHYRLNMENSNFFSWSWFSMFRPHGSVHAWLGGMLDCDAMHSKFVDLVGPEIAKNLAYYAFNQRKNLYRSGHFSCEGSAEPNVKPYELFESGQCGCQGYNLENGDDYVAIMDSLSLLSTTLQDFPEDIKRQVVATICSSTLAEGAHIQSSSSLDPTFWPMHPTMERLWMFKRLTGTMTDLYWPDMDTTWVDDSGENVTGLLSFYDQDCNGHRGSDVFPFGLAADEGSGSFRVYTGIRGDYSPGGNSISNRDILKLLDPRVNSLNYIYDNFRWDHCVADGIDMNDAWKLNEIDEKHSR